MICISYFEMPIKVQGDEYNLFFFFKTDGDLFIVMHLKVTEMINYSFSLMMFYKNFLQASLKIFKINIFHFWCLTDI